MNYRHVARSVAAILFGFAAVWFAALNHVARGAQSRGVASVKSETSEVHTSMSKASKVLLSLKKGELVTVQFDILTSDGSWCYIKAMAPSGTSGYVVCRDLERAPQREEQFSILPPTETASLPEAEALPAPGGEAEALFKAVRRGDLSVVQSMLAAGADVNAKTPAGNTPLISAAFHGQTAVVHALLAAGAQVNQTSNDGSSALMAASYHSRTDAIRALVEAGADVNASNRNRFTALSMTVINGHASAVKTLLDAGANRDIKTPSGMNLAAWALKACRVFQSSGRCEVYQLLK